jgi:hypothetical protein
MKIKKIYYLFPMLVILVLPFFSKVHAAQFDTESKILYNIPSDIRTSIVMPFFSNDGEQFAFVKNYINATSSVIFNGKEVYDNYKKVGLIPKFSPDGTKFAYVVTYNDNRPNASSSHLILNGQDYQSYKSIESDSLIFSADSQHYAFTASADGKMFIVVDKQENNKYDEVSYPNISFDGKRLAYSAKNDIDIGKSLIIDGKIWGKYVDVKYPIVFSADGSHVAYAASNGSWSLFVDDKEVSSGYDNITNIWVGNSGKYAFIGVRGTEYKANINGEESQSYSMASGLIISYDEKRSIFAARRGNNEFAVIDGKEGISYPIFITGSIPNFSPDSKHVVYKTSRFSSDGMKRLFFLVADGQEIGVNGWYFNGFDLGNGQHTEFYFSKNSRYLIYNSLVNKNQIVRNQIDLVGKDDVPVVTQDVKVNSSIKSEDKNISTSGAIIKPTSPAKLDPIANRLKGMILLQVEDKGQAWYVNPKDGRRYYLADGNSAYQVMKNLGIGINNKDLDKIKTSADFRKKFIGKIFLQVESHGEAYYISQNGRYNYLKDGAAAYSVMRNFGIGVTNSDLNKISLGEQN